MGWYVEWLAEVRDESVEEAWDEMCYSTANWISEVDY